jgi:hypothetical protein
MILESPWKLKSCYYTPSALLIWAPRLSSCIPRETASVLYNSILTRPAKDGLGHDVCLSNCSWRGYWPMPEHPPPPCQSSAYDNPFAASITVEIMPSIPRLQLSWPDKITLVLFDRSSLKNSGAQFSDVCFSDTFIPC